MPRQSAFKRQTEYIKQRPGGNTSVGVIFLITIYIRTILIYFVLIASMRMMGKRQIGELQPSELVTALLLSELAAQPVADSNIPLLSAIMPILLLLSIEIILSYLTSHSRIGKRLFFGVPSILIANGTLRQKALERSRVSPEELLAQLRLNGVGCIEDVEYAILEEKGRISVLEKAECGKVRPKDLGLQPKADGILHPLVVEGQLSTKNMQHLQYSKKDVMRMLRSHGITDLKEAYLLSVNDSGQAFCIKKQPNGEAEK